MCYGKTLTSYQPPLGSRNLGSQEILEKSQNLMEAQTNTQKQFSWSCPILFDYFIF